MKLMDRNNAQAIEPCPAVTVFSVPELLDLIQVYLTSNSDLVSLTQVCKSFSLAFGPLIWHTVEIKTERQHTRFVNTPEVQDAIRRHGPDWIRVIRLRTPRSLAPFLHVNGNDGGVSLTRLQTLEFPWPRRLLYEEMVPTAVARIPAEEGLTEDEAERIPGDPNGETFFLDQEYLHRTRVPSLDDPTGENGTESKTSTAVNTWLSRPHSSFWLQRHRAGIGKEGLDILQVSLMAIQVSVRLRIVQEELGLVRQSQQIMDKLRLLLEQLIRHSRRGIGLSSHLQEGPTTAVTNAASGDDDNEMNNEEKHCQLKCVDALFSHHAVFTKLQASVKRQLASHVTTRYGFLVEESKLLLLMQEELDRIQVFRMSFSADVSSSPSSSSSLPLFVSRDDDDALPFFWLSSSTSSSAEMAKIIGQLREAVRERQKQRLEKLNQEALQQSQQPRPQSEPPSPQQAQHAQLMMLQLLRQQQQQQQQQQQAQLMAQQHLRQQQQQLAQQLVHAQQQQQVQIQAQQQVLLQVQQQAFIQAQQQSQALLLSQQHAQVQAQSVFGQHIQQPESLPQVPPQLTLLQQQQFQFQQQQHHHQQQQALNELRRHQLVPEQTLLQMRSLQLLVSTQRSQYLSTCLPLQHIKLPRTDASIPLIIDHMRVHLGKEFAELLSPRSAFSSPSSSVFRPSDMIPPENLSDDLMDDQSAVTATTATTATTANTTAPQVSIISSDPFTWTLPASFASLTGSPVQEFRHFWDFIDTPVDIDRFLNLPPELKTFRFGAELELAEASKIVIDKDSLENPSSASMHSAYGVLSCRSEPNEIETLLASNSSQGPTPLGLRTLMIEEHQNMQSLQLLRALTKVFKEGNACPLLQELSITGGDHTQDEALAGFLEACSAYSDDINKNYNSGSNSDKGVTSCRLGVTRLRFVETNHVHEKSFEVLIKCYQRTLTHLTIQQCHGPLNLFIRPTPTAPHNRDKQHPLVTRLLAAFERLQVIDLSPLKQRSRAVYQQHSTIYHGMGIDPFKAQEILDARYLVNHYDYCMTLNGGVTFAPWKSASTLRILKLHIGGEFLSLQSTQRSLLVEETKDRRRSNIHKIFKILGALTALEELHLGYDLSTITGTIAEIVKDDDKERNRAQYLIKDANSRDYSNSSSTGASTPPSTSTTSTSAILTDHAPARRTTVVLFTNDFGEWIG
ncbi:hypothetical protein BGZ83_011340 [Gryganskiella cystojenkinii]|nr:hypothetical protein BGZ83_011340 [Gryganskiella cystojenkinii]